MLIYLDMCCLKRPFDDQSQPRIRLETEAVLSLLAIEPNQVRFVRSVALAMENDFNPVRERAARVDAWLRAAQLWRPSDTAAFQTRVTELNAMGFTAFDALHVASAEAAQADRFATTDDKLMSVARRNADHLRVRVCGLIECAAERPA